MTQSDAINRMLRYIGELPLPSDISIEELPEGHEAVVALDVLLETVAQEQETAYWFNKYEQTFIPNSGGYISLPYNIISIQSTSNNIDYRIEGNDLYNNSQQTKIFTEPVTVEILIAVEFENLPKAFQTLCILKASQELHIYFNGDAETQKHLNFLIQQQQVKVDMENVRQMKPNLIRGGRLLSRTSNPTALV